MESISQLNAIIKKFDLNNHPFYQEWREGTLPVSRLAAYAAEYSHFVATIADGWDTLGERKIADDERHHEKLWAKFQKALNAGTGMKNHETMRLVSVAKAAFANPASAAGALYAFEAQQPHTSKTKLDGLDQHYCLSDKAKEYFSVHADDIAEAEILALYIKGLGKKEQAEAKEACKMVCEAMWGALDGVYKN